jgi:hypothetical protein
VVERPQEKYGIDTRFRQPKRACVAHLGTGERWSRLDARLFDVERDGIHQVDVVSAFRQPDGVSAWAAADICHHRGRGRKVPLEEHLRAHELERARAVGESVAFESPSIVRRDLAIA